MTIYEDGVISWFPESVGIYGPVTVAVTDGGEDGVATASETFEVTVQAVNDAPVIVSSATLSANEDIEYTYQVTVEDPDDSIDELAFELANSPEGMTIDLSGLITWTPEEGILTSGPYRSFTALTANRVAIRSRALVLALSATSASL